MCTSWARDNYSRLVRPIECSSSLESELVEILDLVVTMAQLLLKIVVTPPVAQPSCITLLLVNGNNFETKGHHIGMLPKVFREWERWHISFHSLKLMDILLLIRMALLKLIQLHILNLLEVYSIYPLHVMIFSWIWTGYLITCILQLKHFGLHLNEFLDT